MRTIDYAMSYASMGWMVIPLHSVIGGKCTCRGQCSSPGKHPTTPKGLNNATISEPVISAWWRKWPWANVGVVTGVISRFIALDIDPRHGGEESLDSLQQAHGKLPETVEAITGSGGRHILFRHPGGQVRNRAGLEPGIDARGDGGYIVVAPSMHVSGNEYAWEASSEPGQVPMAEAPQWLLQKLIERRVEARENFVGAIGEGNRDTYLTSIAGTLWRRGVSAEAVEACLRADNIHRCNPSLPDRDIDRIMRSVRRWPR